MELAERVERRCWSHQCVGAMRTFVRQYVLTTHEHRHLDYSRPIGPLRTESRFYPSYPQVGEPLTVGACEECGNVASISPTPEEVEWRTKEEKEEFHRRQLELYAAQEESLLDPDFP